MDRVVFLLSDKDGSVFRLNENALISREMGCCKLLQFVRRGMSGVERKE